MMMALHIWSMSHGVASLFARGDAARRKLPMSAEDLLEAEVLIYLRGLGFPTDRRPAGQKDHAGSKAGRAAAGAAIRPVGQSEINLRALPAPGLTKIRDGLGM